MATREREDYDADYGLRLGCGRSQDCRRHGGCGESAPAKRIWPAQCTRTPEPLSSRPRSLVVRSAGCCSGERWPSAFGFTLPTSTSSARGVVQFWLTRRPKPAAIYGHRHLGGVSGLALPSFLPQLLSAAVRSFPPFSACERVQQRRSGSRLYHTQRYPPSIHS